jgi:predicted nuclease of predicted toxin-antitoxin system
MLFKIDENLPIEIAELLGNSGHDAKTVHEQQLHGARDSSLMEACDREKRVLVTTDTDFADIRSYPPQDHEGIIVLRIRNQSKNRVITVFRNILPIIDQEPLKRHLWIVEDTIIRIRGEDA